MHCFLLICDRRIKLKKSRRVYSVFQLLDVDPDEQAKEDGSNIDLDSQRKGKCAVIKTSTRQVLKCWKLIR